MAVVVRLSETTGLVATANGARNDRVLWHAGRALSSKGNGQIAVLGGQRRASATRSLCRNRDWEARLKGSEVINDNGPLSPNLAPLPRISAADGHSRETTANSALVTVSLYGDGEECRRVISGAVPMTRRAVGSTSSDKVIAIFLTTRRPRVLQISGR